MRDERALIRAGLIEATSAPAEDLPDVLERLLSEDCVFHVSHPVEELRGRDAVRTGFFEPLRAALRQTRRRDEIFIGGQNTREGGGTWMAALTHYVGTFAAPLVGIAPSDRLAFLRAGEFYRIEAGRIVEARLILDFPDLMRQAGRAPFPPILGTEMLFPGPATHDGVCPPSAGAEASIGLVDSMLRDLHVYDPDTFESKDQTGPNGHWHPDMMWYGPGGIGSTYRWSGFVKDHRAPFLSAFPDRKGGNHYCRIGDGNYAAISGWPSMTATHMGEYLGVPATGKALTLRVMDFYRIAEGRIIENWVLLDYVDLFRQKGLDVLAGEAAPA